jgi:pyrroloquinoline quinone biosynthesis protein B
VAVSADGARWFLLNASPDVHRQVGALSERAPGTRRHVPIEGIAFTDAELDHTIGLLLLREGRSLQVWATCATLATLERDSRFLPVTRAFADVSTVELPLAGAFAGASLPLRYRDGGGSGLSIEAFVVPAGPPRFAGRDEPGHTVGFLVRDVNGGTLAYTPACGGIDDALQQRLAGADLLLFDGTFWTDDELIRLGVSTKRARDMGHLPQSGPGGMLEALKPLRGRKILIHINNTNPILDEDSPERAELKRRDVEVAWDGMEIVL